MSIHPLMPEGDVPRGVAPDPQLIRVLNESFADMRRQGDRLAGIFYDRLFELHPALRALFPKDMSAQRVKLIDSLAMVIEGLRTPEAMKVGLHALGQRHIGYGARPEHYPIVCDLLLEAMRTVSTGWTPLLEAEWRRALQLISAIMLGPRDHAPAVRPSA